jgi:hypothetical protein
LDDFINQQFIKQIKNTFMKKNMFFAIAIAATLLTSCRKGNIFAQTIPANDPTTLASPQIVAYSADASTATVQYNGRQIVLRTVSVKNTNGTGILLEPPTRPSQWNGVVADGMMFNNGHSADMALVYYIYVTYLSATQVTYEVRSRSMYWVNAPNHASDYTAYVPGTFNLKVGWVGGPHSFSAAADGSLWVQ